MATLLSVLISFVTLIVSVVAIAVARQIADDNGKQIHDQINVLNKQKELIDEQLKLVGVVSKELKFQSEISTLLAIKEINALIDLAFHFPGSRDELINLYRLVFGIKDKIELISEGKYSIFVSSYRKIPIVPLPGLFDIEEFDAATPAVAIELDGGEELGRCIAGYMCRNLAEENIDEYIYISYQQQLLSRFDVVVPEGSPIDYSVDILTPFVRFGREKGFRILWESIAASVCSKFYSASRESVIAIQSLVEKNIEIWVPLSIRIRDELISHQVIGEKEREDTPIPYHLYHCILALFSGIADSIDIDVEGTELVLADELREEESFRHLDALLESLYSLLYALQSTTWYKRIIKHDDSRKLLDNILYVQTLLLFRDVLPPDGLSFGGSFNIKDFIQLHVDQYKDGDIPCVKDDDFSRIRDLLGGDYGSHCASFLVELDRKIIRNFYQEVTEMAMERRKELQNRRAAGGRPPFI